MKNVTEEFKLVDSVEALEAKIAEVRAAQKKFSSYTQAQVDQIFKAAAIAPYLFDSCAKSSVTAGQHSLNNTCVSVMPIVGDVSCGNAAA